MDTSKIAAQLYSVRDYTRDIDGFTETLKKIKKIGYSAIQLSGIGPIPHTDVVNTLKDSGLICCATHENGDDLLKNPHVIAEKLTSLNCAFTAFPFRAFGPENTVESIAAFAKELEQSGAILAQSGITLTYHNHAHEFRQIAGMTILDRIYAGSNSAFLAAELDTYWVQAGGGNPVDWCNKLSGRLPLLHLKDYGINEKDLPTFKEIGYGNLNWTAILAAAKNAGTKWFIVEQDTHWTNNDPFESLKMSFEFLKSIAID